MKKINDMTAIEKETCEILFNDLMQLKELMEETLQRPMTTILKDRYDMDDKIIFDIVSEYYNDLQYRHYELLGSLIWLQTKEVK